PTRGVRMRRIVPTMLLGLFVMDLSPLILGLVTHLPSKLCGSGCFRSETTCPILFSYGCHWNFLYQFKKAASSEGERKVMAGKGSQGKVRVAFDSRANCGECQAKSRRRYGKASNAMVSQLKTE